MHNEVSMERVNVLIDRISDIREFSTKASKYANVDLISGRYRIPANSLMGILTLDVTESVEMEYPTDIHNDIIKDFGKWIVEE